MLSPDPLEGTPAPSSQPVAVEHAYSQPRGSDEVIVNMDVDVSDTEDDDDAAQSMPPHIVDLLNRASAALQDERKKAQMAQRELAEVKGHLKHLVMRCLEDQRSGDGGSGGRAAHYMGKNMKALGALCGISVTVPIEVKANAQPRRASSAASRSSSHVKSASESGGQYAKKAPSPRSPQRARHSDPAPPHSTSRQENSPQDGSAKIHRAESIPSAPPAPALTPRAVNTAAAPTKAEAAMMARLRRAMAPAPSKSQMSDVVDGMMMELKRDICRKLEDKSLRWPPTVQSKDPNSAYYFVPWIIHVEKEGMCAYRFLLGSEPHVSAVAESRRRAPGVSIDSLLLQRSKRNQSSTVKLDVKHFLVHLTVDNGDLNVISGGGHISLHEYLKRKIHLLL